MGRKQGEHVMKRALVPGTILNEQYRIEGILGEGGFGITYEGEHLKDNCKVAIKEYFPYGVASREYADSDQNLHIFRGEKEEYLRGRRRFLNEAEILREYQYLQGIVTVMDCFECNHTAYIVMEYVEGITLKQYVEENGCLSFQELLQLLEPVMKAMAQMHRKGVIHRDISPSNLMIGLDNHARLIDFGAADLLENRQKKSNTVILKTGFAPPEQYLAEGKQGPWTDVYAMSAMLYMALTGKTPTDSVARLQGMELEPAVQKIGGLEPWQMQALLTGMELKISHRYKNMEELLNALTVCPSKEDELTQTRKNVAGKVRNQVKQLNQESRKSYKMAVVIVVMLFAGILLWNLVNQRKSGKDNENRIVQTMTDSQTAEVTAGEGWVEQICVMPEVIGMTERDAKELIRESDSKIQISVKQKHSDEIAVGNVVAQDVEADTKYNQGAIEEVVLTISMGKEKNTEETAQAITREKNTTASSVSTKNTEDGQKKNSAEMKKATTSEKNTATNAKNTDADQNMNTTKKKKKSTTEEYVEFEVDDGYEEFEVDDGYEEFKLWE